MQLVGQRPVTAPAGRAFRRRLPSAPDRLRRQLWLRVGVAAFSLGISVAASLLFALALRLAG